jgi:hypothetical protein
MIIGIALAALAFATVIAAVLGQADDLHTKGWKSVGNWGRVALIVGLLVLGFAIAKAITDARERADTARESAALLQRIEDLKEQLSQVPLREENIKLRLLIEYRLEPEGVFPEAVSISGRLGKATFMGEFISTKTDSEKISGGRGFGGYIRYRYLAADLNFIGLGQYPTVDSINGQMFELTIDPGKLPAAPTARKLRLLTVDLYIPGHQFFIGSVMQGTFQKVLDFRQSN